jgi:hypothetical protein
MACMLSASCGAGCISAVFRVCARAAYLAACTLLTVYAHSLLLALQLLQLSHVLYDFAITVRVRTRLLALVPR